MIRRTSRSFILLCISLALAGFGAGQLASGAWIHAKARLAQHLLDAAWQETRVSGGERIARPWPWADTWPVARLSLPRLGASFIVLSGDAGSSRAFGPGHNTASALPGHPGTAVISGHRDTHFRALARLRPGDRIEIERPDGVTIAYRIASLDVADTRRDRLHLAEKSPRARPALALVTCWPFNAVQPGGPLRYVVSAYMNSPDRASRGRKPHPNFFQPTPPDPATQGRTPIEIHVFRPGVSSIVTRRSANASAYKS